MNKVKSNILKIGRIVIFLLSIVIFGCLVYFLLRNELSTFDSMIYCIISKNQNPFLTYFFRFISFLCSTYFVVFLTVIYMLFTKDKKKGFYVGLNVILCVLLNQIAKQIFRRDRPILINLINETGYSFPSGHSMVSLAFYGFFIYLLYQRNMDRKLKYGEIICLACLVLLVGISRIYLGVHYASDVLGGYSLAVIYLNLYIQFIYNRRKRN